MADKDVTLAAGTIYEHLTSSGVWKRIPRLTTTGETGFTAEAKEKTTTEDRIKRYGSGLRDGGDKTIKGRIIPPNVLGDEYFIDYTLQQEFIARCKNEEEMQVRVTFPSFERCVLTFKALGYIVDEVSGEDWLGFTVSGKQNTVPDWQVSPELTAIVVADATVAVDAGAQLQITNTPSDAFYEVNEDTFTSSDTSLVTVTKWGYVKRLAAGPVTITVKRKIGNASGGSVTVAVAID